MERLTLIGATLKASLLSQNPLLLTLTLLSALALAVVVDRLWFWIDMGLRYRPISPDVLSNDAQRRREAVGQPRLLTQGHYLHQVVQAYLEPGAGEEQLSQTIAEQVAGMNARLGLLDLIAKIAPLIGILGTVLGMATSFGGVGAMASASPTAISSGISVALQTTAYGLVISIVATVTTVGFKRLTDRALLKIGRICCEIQQVENTHSQLDCNIQQSTDHHGRFDPHDGHHLPDYPVAAGDPDAQLHRPGFSGKLPQPC